MIIESLRPRRIGMSPFSEAYFREGVRENPGTEPAGGELLRKGSIRYPNGPKAFYNHGILFRLAKKSLKNLHMCKICCTFVR